MAEIFDEENMRSVLGKYIPEGETLIAGIHAVSKEMEIRSIFGKCTVGEDSLIPGGDRDIMVVKKKYAGCDIYLGVTEYSFIISECEREKYLYEFVNVGELADEEGGVTALGDEILHSDIGKSFALKDIADVEIKKGMLGSKKCLISMKNGGYFKLMIPKLGGLGDGMPHYAEYKEQIIGRLTAAVS